jgi:transposase-like protein
MAQKRRKFSAEFKLDTAMEGLRGQRVIGQICRERDITEALYYQWKQRFEERVLDIFEDERQRNAP